MSFHFIISMVFIHKLGAECHPPPGELQLRSLISKLVIRILLEQIIFLPIQRCAHHTIAFLIVICF